MASNRELYSMMSSMSFSGSITQPARDRLTELKVGDRPSKGFEFCPYKLIRKYPFMYESEHSRDLHECMKTTIFDNRTWTFFYLLDPGPNHRDPLLLVPSSQFEEYLSYVSAFMKVRFSIPSGQEREQFFVTFGEMDSPLPRFIGHANSYNALDSLRPQILKLPKDDLTRLGAVALKHYNSKMDTIYATIRSEKKKKDAETARLRRFQRHKGCGRMMKRAQRYLGLRSPVTEQAHSRIPGTEWNGNLLAPFSTDGSVRFVCVDVEAWERATHIVTEIGLAILDTRDIRGVPPGGLGVGYNWFSLVKSYHFRIREHIDKVNHQFVAGCPDSFQFGQSYIVSSRDISGILSTVIEDKESEEKRRIVMVGHDIGQDLKYMTKVGYNIWRVPQFSDEVDTKSMFQVYEKSPNGRGLQAVCSDLGIPGHHFHNAGNDATYTLRAMIAMAVSSVSQPYARRNLIQHSNSDPGEWSDGSMDDGGLPGRSAEPVLQSNHGAGGQASSVPYW
ncbi:ATP-dependent DNA helicase yku80 [Hypoxylon texense]